MDKNSHAKGAITPGNRQAPVRLRRAFQHMDEPFPNIRIGADPARTAVLAGASEDLGSLSVPLPAMTRSSSWIRKGPAWPGRCRSTKPRDSRRSRCSIRPARI